MHTNQIDLTDTVSLLLESPVQAGVEIIRVGIQIKVKSVNVMMT